MVEIPARYVKVFAPVFTPVTVNILPYSEVPSGKSVVVTPIYDPPQLNGRLCRKILVPIEYPLLLKVVTVVTPLDAVYATVAIPLSSYPQVNAIPESLALFG